MLSIQQLIKTLRSLQTAASSSNGGEAIRQNILKYLGATVPTTTRTTTPHATSNDMMTSSATEYKESSTSSKIAKLPKQQLNKQQEPFEEDEIFLVGEELEENQSSSSSLSPSSSLTLSTRTARLISLLNASRGETSATAQQQRQQQQHQEPTIESKYAFSLNSYLLECSTATEQPRPKQAAKDNIDFVDTSENIVEFEKLNSTVAAAVATYHQRSQQIQKFYQQQLHHFHTQHNQSLYAKQKQMSSLAAEPLTVKQDGNSGNCCDANTDENATKQSNASSASSANSQPCFNSGLAEILQFMELIGNLKHTKRTGWVLRDVNDCESISGHMYRMSMMTFLLDGSEGLNQIRCMQLALVHDLAESLVGDITPFCGVSKEEKRAMEFKAMADICKLIEPRGKRIMELFEEYELGQSAESRFVKDLDRLDMVMQAFEYEKRDDCLLKHQEFFDSTEGKFKHPFVQKLVNEIYEQRKQLAHAKGATPPPKIDVPNMDDPTPTSASSTATTTTAAAAATTNGHCTATLEEQTSTNTTS